MPFDMAGAPNTIAKTPSKDRPWEVVDWRKLTPAQRRERLAQELEARPDCQIWDKLEDSAGGYCFAGVGFKLFNGDACACRDFSGMELGLSYDQLRGLVLANNSGVTFPELAARLRAIRD